MKVTIIGMGLIGGSLALALRDKGWADNITGVEANPEHAALALSLGLADEIRPLEEAVDAAEMIVLAVPVSAAGPILQQVLDKIQQQVVLDMGSTKFNICRMAAAHPNRARFVATHPMWGTEYSGPAAAVRNAFENKAVVICNKEESDPAALATVEKMYRLLGMHLICMDAAAHDLHAAYVSHISHITSFALANTVLEKEKEDDAIFELASGGFESTVRLAKSNPAMWVPIFQQNRENVLDVLNEHISQLRKFKSCLEKENYAYLEELIAGANKIRRIIK